MPTPTKGPRLGSGPAHERLMLANLASALFEHGRITTTQAKAKRLRPLAERLVTFAKKGDLPARRKVMTVIRDKGVVHELFEEIGPRYANRHGGYTRITKIGPRKGDNAPMAVIELVEPLTDAKAKPRRAAKPAAATAAAAPVVEETLEQALTEETAETPVETPVEDADAVDTVDAEAESTPESPVVDEGTGSESRES